MKRSATDNHYFIDYYRYSLPDKFYVEPRDKIGAVVSNSYLEIDRISSEIRLRSMFIFFQENYD